MFFFIFSRDKFSKHEMYRRLLRCSSARGSVTRLFRVLRFRLISLFYSLKVPLKLKISLRMRRSLVKLSGFVKTVTKMVIGCLRTMKVASHTCIRWLKSGFSKLWKKWDSVYVCQLVGFYCCCRIESVNPSTNKPIQHCTLFTAKWNLMVPCW